MLAPLELRNLTCRCPQLSLEGFTTSARVHPSSFGGIGHVLGTLGVFPRHPPRREKVGAAFLGVIGTDWVVDSERAGVNMRSAHRRFQFLSNSLTSEPEATRKMMPNASVVIEIGPTVVEIRPREKARPCYYPSPSSALYCFFLVL